MGKLNSLVPFRLPYMKRRRHSYDWPRTKIVQYDLRAWQYDQEFVWQTGLSLSISY